MPNWRRNRRDPTEPDERAWSAHANVDPSSQADDLVRRSPLPAETGPTWAPDRLSVWPVEGGRFGIDAVYHGKTGMERARGQQRRLERSGLRASVRPEKGNGIL